MPQAAKLSTALNGELHHEIKAVIAKRPEWRFLEQQRHLQDVLRLLLRDIETEKNLANANWSNQDIRQKALNHCWLGLIMSQELNHPPQLTRDIFNQIFFTQMHDIPKTNKRAPWAHQSVETQEIQNLMLLFTAELYRLQNMISWEQPWYLTRTFLPFLADRLPKSWLDTMYELMLLLEQHASLLSAEAEPRIFKKSDLHTSHPLRKQALEALRLELHFYENLDQCIQNLNSEIPQALQLITASHPKSQELHKAINAAQAAWGFAKFAQTYEQQMELCSLLFEEARYQRCCIAKNFESELKTIHALKDPQLKPVQQLFKQFFEVHDA